MARRTISDVRALAALAHPVRVALLNHLMAFGPRTASQCSAAVAASPSACSYHLRQLHKWGFVEPAEGEDGRERPWRATATGFSFGGRSGDPEVLAAQQSLASIQLESDLALARDFLRGADELDPAWREATEFARYSIKATPAEVAELVRSIDALVRPFIGLTRSDAPDGAKPVHVSLNAFLEPGGAS